MSAKAKVKAELLKELENKSMRETIIAHFEKKPNAKRELMEVIDLIDEEVSMYQIRIANLLSLQKELKELLK